MSVKVISPVDVLQVCTSNSQQLFELLQNAVKCINSKYAELEIKEDGNGFGIVVQCGEIAEALRKFPEFERKYFLGTLRQQYLGASPPWREVQINGHFPTKAGEQDYDYRANLYITLRV